MEVNVDATFQAETLSGVTGAVARGEHGNFIAATTWFLPHVTSVNSAEMAAIRNGMFLASTIGRNGLLIESECSFTVEAVHRPHSYVGLDVARVMECKQLTMWTSGKFHTCTVIAKQKQMR